VSGQRHVPAVEDVPAQARPTNRGVCPANSGVCPNCGEAYVDEDVTDELLQTAERMAAAGAQVDGFSRE
jgi:hypothetical protein